MKFYILLLLLAIDIIAAQNTTTTTKQTTVSTATTATTLSTTASTASTKPSTVSTASTASTKPSTASTASTTASTASTASTTASTASTASTTASTASTASTTASTASTASTTASTASTASTTASTASTASTTASTASSTASTKASTASSTAASTASSRASTASSTAASTASSTPASTASSTAASTAPSTAAPTTPKPSVQQNFTCKDGNTTKFSLTGSFTLFITYNKTNVGLTTIPIEVPQTKNFQGTCGNASTESLTFAFFNGWSITYVFQEEVSSENGLLSATNKYYVSNITVIYVHDEHLPDTTTPEVKVESKIAQDRYLEATTDGYYTCQTNISLAINKDVTLTTADFKYKAFNKQGDINLDSGTATECSKDLETDSTVPIAVAAVLAGLAIFGFIGYQLWSSRRKPKDILIENELKSL